MKVACFVSPHGFGHAARCCAVLEAWKAINPQLQVTIFSKTPRWFFEQTLQFNFAYRDCLSDIGLVQQNPLQVDLPETLSALKQFLPFDGLTLQPWVEAVKKQCCQAILCDISPLGVAVAKLAKLPSVLIENFTWDWIYEGYLNEESGLRPIIDYYRELNTWVNFHVQTQPLGNPNLEADLEVGPISRKSRQSRQTTRSQLGIPDRKPMILITMGGIPQQFGFLEKLKSTQSFTFVIPGGADKVIREDNLILLPHHNDFYHPDLVLASDLVVSKLGYSTVAEVYHAEIPLIFAERPDFRESAAIEKYFLKHRLGFGFSPKAFEEAEWLPRLEELLDLKEARNQAKPAEINSAEVLAKQLKSWLI